MMLGNGRSCEEIREALEQIAQFGIPPSGAASCHDVGTADFLDHFTSEVLDRLVLGGLGTCRFYEGAFGAGKTHLLELLLERALERGMLVVRTDLSQALSLSDWRLVTAFILQNIQVRDGGRSITGLPYVLEHLRESGAIDATSFEGCSLPHRGFQNAFRYALRQDLDDVAGDRLHEFLLGNRVSVAELRKRGVRGVKDPLSARNAEQVLETVLAALYRLGLPGTLLVFDENEKTFVAQRERFARKTRYTANLMRRLVDSCAAGSFVGAVAVFAVLPGFIGLCSEVLPALGQRLQVPFWDGQGFPWRWPFLPVDKVNSLVSRRDFLEALAATMESLVETCGGRSEGLARHLVEEGGNVLEEQAGTSFRRPLMKRLATLTLARM